MDFSISGLWMNGQQTQVLTDDRTPEVELRCNGIPDWVQLKLTRHDQICCDSGPMPYTGPFLTLPAVEPKSEYQLVVTAGKGQDSETAQLSFDTGFMGGAWAGLWIEPEQDPAQPEPTMAFWENFIPRPMPAPEQDGAHLRRGQTLRRDFTLDRRPERAVLYATARGVYTPYLNGQRVGENCLAPEITPYDQLLYYQRYDLTGLLWEGRNELQVELGDGWYAGRIGLSGSSCQYGERLSFLGQLELTYSDGGRQIIGTDEHFESRPSWIAYSDLSIGEKWDLLSQPGEWSPCRVVEPPAAKVAAQPLPAIRAFQEFPGKLLSEEANGLLVDFGQDLAGVVRITFRVQHAAAVVLEHTEVLDREGHFFRNIVGRNKQQRDQIVCGPGEYTFQPLHTYHGFRYVHITGLTREELLDVRAVALTTPLEATGSFQCSDPELNQLQHNIQWSMYSNFLSIPTDCPQREKMGWTGDVLAFADTGSFLARLLPLLKPWLGQMRLEQRENGEVPNIIPAFPIDDRMARENWGDNTSSAWGDACILVPLALYQATGNVGVLKENLPMMERWLEFVGQASASEGDPLLWTSGHHFGDWLIPSMAGDPRRVDEGVIRTGEVTACAYRAIALDGWRQVLEALLAQGEDPKLREKLDGAVQLLTEVRRAVRENYVLPDGQIKGDLQGLYVTVLRSGAVEGALRQKVADRLAQLIRRNGDRLDTGFVSTPYLLDVLSENGHQDLAWKLLFQKRAPSWLYQVERGATTIWENWTAVLEDGTPTDSSMDHYALGAVGRWIYQHVGGIQLDAPGWRRVRFAPDLSCGLMWSRCSEKIAYGLVSCSWERHGDEGKIKLQTPVPARWCWQGEEKYLEPGMYEFAVLCGEDKKVRV